MRVLHITNAYPYDEVPEYGIFVKEQVDYIAEHPAISDSKLIFINGRKYGKKAYLKAVREIKEASKLCDIIHCHHLYSALACLLARTGKPVVLSFLNDWLHEMDGVNSMILRKILCNLGVITSSGVIFKSPIPKNLIGLKGVYHLPNGVDISQFKIKERDEAKRRLGLNPDINYVLFVSSKDLNRVQKRYDRFIDVINKIKIRFPDVRCEPLMLVNKPRPEVEHYFNAASVHLMTSDFEGSPNSVKEAVASGTPVVSTDVGNVKSMIEGLPGCYVASSFDVDELAELTIKSIKSDTIREEIRDKFAERGFDRKISIEKVVEVYNKSIRRKTSKV